MAGGGGETLRQLVTLIRDLATEKSRGERRVAGLKRRVEQLRHGFDATHSELEEMKRCKELMEKEIKGHQVELSLNESLIHAIQLSFFGLTVLVKNDENRDEFFGHMIDFNKKIREFQKTVCCTSHEQKNIELALHNGDKVEDQEMLKIEAVFRDLKNKLDKLASQKHVEELEYQEKQINHKKVSVMEAVVKETKELQEFLCIIAVPMHKRLNPLFQTHDMDFILYDMESPSLTNSKQTVELEESYADLGDKLQGRCACPSCHLDNMATLGGLLEANQES